MTAFRELTQQPEAERPELWAVHAQGPDELYAAFNRADAEKHAAELNCLPVPVSVSAVVIPSPWPAAEHWQYLAEQERDHKNEIAVRLRQFERICEGLPQDAIDGGWTVQGIRGYAKRLEDQLKVAQAEVEALRAELQSQRERNTELIFKLGSATNGWGRCEKERDAAQARCAELKAELAMANDAAAKGDAARHQCAGMEMEIKELRGAADHWEAESRALQKLRDAALAKLAELEKQEPAATVAKVPGEDWNSLDFHLDLQGMLPGTKLYTTPVAQAQHSVPEEFSFEYRHPNGECHTVTVSREQVINEMPDFLFEALCSKFCNCEPVGETNVVECCCDEYAEEFKLIAAAPGKEGV
ncbi:TPA: hypothetical protein P8O34_003052 [Pseudomonas aeruginosa]|nr:hypothetical protein [Pseudomonas aeruginosa]